ncbi:ABC transporter permease [Mycoplasmopsis columboralis]|uniref:Oligopeptide ABC transporter permease n=1 Tax=Mycoplasmopsis columboralis TaxID=171282 RepID=A0A449B6F7_9BACT|nr:ABC transporter permease [Mycoplasmopsis columboralis]VEU76098.1 oligopeptide ABC transporter permease [Mycoplasmopsis columboralis]
MKVLNITLKKILWGLVSLFLVLSLSFFILSFLISPSGNILINYFKYLASIFTFKFGFFANENNNQSFNSVPSLYTFYFSKSLLLILPSFLLALIFGAVVGSIIAYIKNKILNNLVTITLYFLSSLPIFILAPIFIVFAEQVNWPSVVIDFKQYNTLSSFVSLILPNLLIFIICASFFTLKVKESTQEILAHKLRDFAYAKGLSKRRIFFKHIWKNAYIKYAPSIAILYAFVLSYSIIVERVFQVQGQSLILINAFKEGELYLILYFIFATLVSIIVFQIIVEFTLIVFNPVYKDNLYNSLWKLPRRSNE